jgi:hypothetical protein
MSYDVAFHVQGPYDDQEVELWWRNHTSNTSGMWRAAGVDIAELAGVKGEQVAVAVNAAIEEMERNPDTYKAMNPPNGWGSYETCLDFLRDLRAAAARFPDLPLWVSR